jgi:hypothetical protein
MGSALGAAVLGAIANGVIAGSGRSPTDPVAATAAGTAVFIGVFVAAALTVVAGLLMPNVSAPIATDQPAPSDAEAATG